MIALETNGDETSPALRGEQEELALAVSPDILRRARRLDLERDLNAIAYDIADLKGVLDAIESLGLTPSGVDGWQVGSQGPRAFLLLERPTGHGGWRVRIEHWSKRLHHGSWQLAFAFTTAGVE